MSNSRVTRGVAIASDGSPEEIDVLCDAFEDAYRRGENPRIEDYLEQCEGPLRSAVFAELMLVELELRQDPEKKSSYRRYLASFPEFSDIIETLAFKHGLTTSHSPGVSHSPGLCPGASPSTGSTTEAPTRIAHFQLQEKLGAGGMGEVWRAWDSRLQRTVAIKLPRNRQLSEQELHRFLREGRAAAQLKHPGIVPVHEVGRDGDLAYIVSDFVAGQSLQQLLDEQPLKPHRAAELASQLADALHHAHERGIVHRDLKPSNILLSADGNPHVVDFGIAKWADDTHNLTLQGSALGTPAYMSPEQAAGDSSNVDRRADVYALGAILYKMLTGQVPYPGEDPAAILRAVIEKSPPPPRSLRRDLPRDLETICIKAMEKEPSRRYATAEAMAADLVRFLNGDPIVGRRPSLLEKTVRLVRKRPAAVVAIALGLLAIAAAGVAGALARENRALQEGLVTVNLETNPPGAKVVFVPLDEATQEPQGEKAVHPGTRSPVSVDLKPGDYLVVAAMDGGRFHEVFRHVPKDRREMITANRHQRWEWKDEEVVLPPIDIPELTVTQGMALIDATSDKGAAAKRAALTDAFFMDVRELSYRDCQRCFSPATVDRKRELNIDEAIAVNFDRACLFAELMGKRLPSAAEFERAAVLTRLSQCDVPLSEPPKEFGVVGTPDCDRVGRQTPIAGIYSNVAEWTTTVFVAGDGAVPEFANAPGRPIPFRITGMRLVKGGDESVVEGNPTLAAEHRDPTALFGVSRVRSKPGLGLRCVRSASPRFLND